MHFPIEVKKIFEIFDDKIKLVGGAVRNFILSEDIKDYDFATILKPEQVVEILKQNHINYYTTGISHGTIAAIINRPLWKFASDKEIKVDETRRDEVYKDVHEDSSTESTYNLPSEVEFPKRSNGKSFEITTLRIDKYCDGRHADVEYTDSWEQDSNRRDLTMNAIYMDKNGKLYDYHNGIEDAKSGTIKFIGNADDRIKEDYLRILRMFRFYSYYGKKSLDYKLLQVCRDNAADMQKLSKERIKSEFDKILISPNFIATLALMIEYDILKPIGINIDNNDIDNLAKLREFEIKNNRPLPKLASDRKIKGDETRIDEVYKDVHEDSSTESTYNLPSEVEFPKRSNFEPSFLRYLYFIHHNISNEKYDLSNKEKKFIKQLDKAVNSNIRPLPKLASDRKIKGDEAHRDEVYKDVHEDSSTESTYNLPSEVEFPKRSINESIYYYGKEIATEAVIYRHILYSEKEPIGIFEYINSVNSDLPVTSKDIIDLGYFGKEIGDAIKKAEKIWINSGFQATKQDILDLVDSN